jgi:hypothetical protein
MVDFPWMNYLPDNSVEGGIGLANKLFWNITVHHGNGRWVVCGGEDVIFRGDSREATEAFLYGLGLAYAVLPEEIFERLRENVRRVVE